MKWYWLSMTAISLQGQRWCFLSDGKITTKRLSLRFTTAFPSFPHIFAFKLCLTFISSHSLFFMFFRGSQSTMRENLERKLPLWKEIKEVKKAKEGKKQKRIASEQKGHEHQLTLPLLYVQLSFNRAYVKGLDIVMPYCQFINNHIFSMGLKFYALLAGMP